MRPRLPGLLLCRGPFTLRGARSSVAGFSCRTSGIYLDLADAHWRAVEIAPTGWQVVEAPPVRFRRPPGLLPLPIPERGGSLEPLRRQLNLPGQDDFVLVVAWLFAALRANGPTRCWPFLASRARQKLSSVRFLRS